MRYRRADYKDRAVICRLLSKFNLPHEDIPEFPDQFIVADDETEMAGCIGIEIYEKDGLLRSMAVEESYRIKGIGRRLIHHLQALAIENGVENLHLLTETAEAYFLRFGFSKADRRSAPSSIIATKEFSILCPSHSVYMVKENIRTSPAYFSSELRVIKTDEATGSKYWKVSSDKMTFTRFDVPPGQTFLIHSHESEQMTCVLEGKLFFTVENEVFILEKGDFIFIPANKKHKVWTETEGAVAVDVWNSSNSNY